MSISSRPQVPSRRSSYGQRRWTLLAGIPVAVASALLLSGCDNGASATHGTKKPKVVVTTPITDTVMDYQDFTGRLDAVQSVDIRARVSGFITEAPFKEGDPVKEGDLLFQIDIRPYKADLNQAMANLKLSIADRDYQVQNAERAGRMFATKAISTDDYQKALMERDKSAAAVGAFEAAREKAKLYVDYTRVTSPLTGRISRRFVDPGNLVNQDNTILTTVVTENPVWGWFDVDERTYLNLLAQIAPGLKSWSEGLSLPVMMQLANEKDFQRIGTVNFVDNRITATTGTVKMRGVFDNSTDMLKPGLFARFRLPMGAAYQSIIIPDEAIQSDQERKYVWVVNKNNEVEYRSVTLGQAIGELRVIRPAEKGKEGKEGLAVDERIIISGMQRVRKGTVVEADAQPPPEPPHMALVRLIAEGKKR
jgi:membrane fusion protein, multidrug efflux system